MEHFKKQTIKAVREHPELKTGLKTLNRKLKNVQKCRPSTLESLMANFGNQVYEASKPGRKKGSKIGVSDATKGRRVSGEPSGAQAKTPGRKRKQGKEDDPSHPKMKKRTVEK